MISLDLSSGERKVWKYSRILLWAGSVGQRDIKVNTYDISINQSIQHLMKCNCQYVSFDGESVKCEGNFRYREPINRMNIRNKLWAPVMNWITIQKCVRQSVVTSVALAICETLEARIFPTGNDEVLTLHRKTSTFRGVFKFHHHFSDLAICHPILYLLPTERGL